VARFIIQPAAAAVSPWARRLFDSIRFRNPVQVSSIEAPLASSRRLLTGSTQLQVNKAAGDTFEDAVRGSLRTTKGTSVLTSQGIVRPDLPVGNLYGVTDAKNVVHLYQTPQTRGFFEVAKSQDVPFNLIVSPRTQTISGPLRQSIERTGGTIFEFDPVTETFKKVIIEGNKVIR